MKAGLFSKFEGRPTLKVGAPHHSLGSRMGPEEWAEHQLLSSLFPIHSAGRPCCHALPHTMGCRWVVFPALGAKRNLSFLKKKKSSFQLFVVSRDRVTTVPVRESTRRMKTFLLYRLRPRSLIQATSASFRKEGLKTMPFIPTTQRVVRLFEK